MHYTTAARFFEILRRRKEVKQLAIALATATQNVFM